MRVTNIRRLSHALNERIRSRLLIGRLWPTELRVLDTENNVPRLRARRIRCRNIHQSFRRITPRIRLPRTTLVRVRDEHTARPHAHLIRRRAGLPHMQVSWHGYALGTPRRIVQRLPEYIRRMLSTMNNIRDWINSHRDSLETVSGIRPTHIHR